MVAIMAKAPSVSNAMRIRLCCAEKRGWLIDSRLLLDQLQPDGVLDQRGRGSDAEHLHDLVLVRFGGPRRNLENGCHFLHRAAFGHELQNLALARSQRSLARALAARFHEKRDEV